MPTDKTKKPDPKKPVAKKPAAVKMPSGRMVAKVSPLAGMSVAEYIANQLSGWQAEAATALVEIVQTAAPASTASIKWSQPVFEENGPFAYLKPSKKHLTFGFWRGTELDDPRHRLEGDGDRMKHVKITGPEAIDARLFADWVRKAVVLNRAKGNPTKR